MVIHFFALHLQILLANGFDYTVDSPDIPPSLPAVAGVPGVNPLVSPPYASFQNSFAKIV